MKIDALVAEIGSTTTVVSAFTKLNTDKPIFLGQGVSKTTVLEGDVNIGLNQAILNLESSLSTKLEISESFASSSSAGGLKMSVHGLVYDMTVKAAKEAALGAGANIHFITAGKLSQYDLNKIKNIKLNIIMIAGGVDYGEASTALYNANLIASLKLNIPVIYAGNIVNHEEIKAIFKFHNQIEFLYITKNVYPKIDIIDVSEARKIIQRVFEEHITKAPGMEKVRLTITNNIIPTPGAVMEASLLLQKAIGNLITVDVGGATTDVHSVTEDSIEVSRCMMGPEPFSKRTVEGDLGVFINKDNIINLIGIDNLIKELKISQDDFEKIISNYEAIPKGKQVELVERLTYEALVRAIERHAGKYVNIYGSSGKSKVAEGKDLTEVKYIIATGGALTRLPNRLKIIQDMLNKKDELLLKPKNTTKILIDNYYIMASLGVLAKKYPQAALNLLKQSLNIGE